MIAWVVYTVYLVLGGVVFMYVEHNPEEHTEVIQPPEWDAVRGECRVLQGVGPVNHTSNQLNRAI